MTTKQAVNQLLARIGQNGMDGLKVHAHSLSAALDRLCPADLSPTLRMRVIAELKRQGLIEATHTGSVYQVHPSVKGIHRLQRAQVEGITITPPKKWDGIWRMVTYDVPRAQSAQRRLFARQLNRLGFTMLRESVWLHPYPCFAKIEELISYCGLQRHVTLAEITRLDNLSTQRLLRYHPELITK